MSSSIAEKLEAAKVGSVALSIDNIDDREPMIIQKCPDELWWWNGFSESAEEAATYVTHIIPADALAQYEVKP